VKSHRKVKSHHSRGAAALISALLAHSAFAGERGGIVGWVENTQGAPVAGAVVSVFGKGAGQSGVVTLTDSSGQFVLPRLPAGSYTLRALDNGHRPAPARRFTVLPDRDATFTVSLTPLGEEKGAPREETASRDGQETATRREWRWLLAHKRRSVLEERANEAPPTGLALAESVQAPRPYAFLSDLGGSVELIAVPRGPASSDDSSLSRQGTLRLRGRLADGFEWNLAGLVTENAGRSWRMAAEFTLTPDEGIEIETGAGYGSGLTRQLGSSSGSLVDPRETGAMFMRSRVKVADNVEASFGTRYAYLGFLRNPNHMDSLVAIEVEAAPGTVIRGSMTSRALAPGGDLLTLSSLDSAPHIAHATINDALTVSRTSHYDLSVDRTIGGTSFGARAFYEETANQLVNVFGTDSASQSLWMSNFGDLSTRGIGVTVAHQLGDVTGSVTYTYGHSARLGPGALAASRPLPLAAGFRRADFHDIEAHLETSIDRTATKLEAFCRINTLSPEAEEAFGAMPFSSTRFDLQLTQGLPFLHPVTRAEWELLLAFRNLFYERGEGGALDELVVLHPPKRVMGGIAVRF
jgi:hypothetical protein